MATSLEAIATAITHPIGAAISVLAAIAAGMGWSHAQAHIASSSENAMRYGREPGAGRLGQSIFE